MADQLTRRDLKPGDFFTPMAPDMDRYSPALHINGRVYYVLDDKAERDVFRGSGGVDTVIGDVYPGCPVRKVYGVFFADQPN